jgi:hypothetical protein
MSDPFRTAPAPRSRFYVSSDGNDFIDLDEVVVVFWRDNVDGDDCEELEGPFAEVYLRTAALNREEFRFGGDNGPAFMRALIAYRTGE